MHALHAMVIWLHSASALNCLGAAQVQCARLPAPVTHSLACVLTPVSTAAQRCMATSALPDLPMQTLTDGLPPAVPKASALRYLITPVCTCCPALQTLTDELLEMLQCEELVSGWCMPHSALSLYHGLLLEMPQCSGLVSMGRCCWCMLHTVLSLYRGLLLEIMVCCWRCRSAAGW